MFDFLLYKLADKVLNWINLTVSVIQISEKLEIKCKLLKSYNFVKYSLWQI